MSIEVCMEGVRDWGRKPPPPGNTHCVAEQDIHLALWNERWGARSQGPSALWQPGSIAAQALGLISWLPHPFKEYPVLCMPWYGKLND